MVAFQTAAGTFRLSPTRTSRRASSAGRESVLSTNPRTKSGSIGSASLETVDSHSSCATVLAPQGERRTEQHEAEDAIGEIQGEALSDQAAARAAGDDRVLDAEHVHEGRKVGGEISRTVAGPGAAGTAVPPQGRGDRADGRGKQIEKVPRRSSASPRRRAPAARGRRTGLHAPDTASARRREAQRRRSSRSS